MGRRNEQLNATISVEDKASKQIDRITKTMQKQNNELLRLKASMEKVRNQSKKKIEQPKVETKTAVKQLFNLQKAFENVQRAAHKTGSVFSGLGSLNPAMLLGGAGALGGLYAGKQVFDNTFLPAAQYEMSAKTIEAMFNDKKKSDRYMKEMEKMAIGSPLLNSQDIFGNSKSFIAMSKNQEELSKMWDLSERLLAVDPTQGVEGSVFALRELFSGDAISMARRFEMPKKELNAIAKLPIDKQLKALDKLFNKMGMTKKLVTEMGDTTLGTWNQIKETIQVALRKVGDPAVKIIKPFLDDANRALQSGKLSPYIKFGQDMASGIAKGFVKVAKGVGGWIDGIVNDPAFQRLDTIEQKFQFVLDRVYTTIDGWYEKDGKQLLYKIGNGLVDTLIVATENNLPRITELGLKVGGAFAAGIAQAVTENTLAKAALEGKVPKLNLKTGIDTVKSVGIGNPGAPLSPRGFNDLVKIGVRKARDIFGGNKKAIGMSRVPRDNYPALLHEGEEIRTKQQVNTQKLSGDRSSVVVQIAKMVIREEADIDKVADQLATKIQRAKLNYGGGM
ncbi:hypothetical protein M3196_00120 [Fictibacillus nanhaiensis]|uniref:hypothetical protein n=1 Tax=Fictibacillus nanhaiensis TaxID=742169 RepID=UPI0020421F47|nr:hypothetical protein [Fictibacillus nanhaiensis]MCM3730074.1 hypothetical protein [Fictibacillus nanhaiensis]